MAQRRMFSPKIVGSDAFLEMPTSSRELYFQLGMYADDDGFINPKKIVRMVGSSDDDLKVLIAKRFVIPFENGVVVIKHWAINNLIRKDWYQPTIYQDQKKLLTTKENGAYTEAGKLLVNKSLTEDRIDQDRIDKDRREDKGVKISPLEFFSNNELQDFLVDKLISKGFTETETKREIKKFIAYWCETNAKGKERWKAEKFFDVRRRLATWFTNYQNYKGRSGTAGTVGRISII